MITSASNGRVKGVIHLSKKTKLRNEKKLFIIEGIKLFLEAPKERIREIYISESFYRENKDIDYFKKLDYEIVADDIFEKMSDTITPQGILCVVEQFEYKLEEIIDSDNSHIIILENIQDPGNLGTIIRTSEGAGVTGVIITKGSADIYQPKVIRSTMGSIYRVPFVYVEDIKEAIYNMKSKNIKVYAAHLEGENEYFDTDISKSSAILIGNEGNGIKDETLKLVDEYIRIPMMGEVESLNAAVAASLLMYEVLRQRRK